MTPIIVPVLLVKNEEVWIGRILSALSNVFPHIIVTDTGSTDSTIEQVEKVSGVMLIEMGNVSPRELTSCRQYMQAKASSSFNATHIFLVDGDELYTTKYLRYIANNPMPEHYISGFTSGIEVGEMENGEFWFYHTNGVPTGLNRQAIIPVNSLWKGVYPFESPDCYIPGSPLNHYFPAPEGSRGFFHLHHTRRSYRDSDVYLRSEKRGQFSLRPTPPEIQPGELWLKDWDSYVDEE